MTATAHRCAKPSPRALPCGIRWRCDVCGEYWKTEYIGTQYNQDCYRWVKAEDRAALVHLVGDDGVLLCCARRPKPDEVATDNPFMASCTSAAGKELGA